MNGTPGCGEARKTLGVYALDAIGPAERSAVDAHLSGCAECRAELAGLSAIAVALAKVEPEDASALTERDATAPHLPSVVPPPRSAAPVRSAPAPESLSAARNRRKRHGRLRIAVAGAAAAALVALAGLGGALLGASHAQPVLGVDNGTALGSWRTASAAGAAGAHATIRYRAMDWGTQVAVQTTGIPPQTVCSVQAVGPDGTTSAAGSWATDSSEGTVWYPAGTALSGARIARFVITIAGHPAITVPA